MRFQTTVGLSCLTAVTAVTPVVSAHFLHSRQENTTDPPCAQIAAYTQNVTSGYGIIPAEVAYNCIMSVPLNATSAKAVLFDLPLYLVWQSTIDVLRDPPAEYVEKIQDPVDILAGLDEISAAIDNGEITSEYDFGWRLYTLITAAHDGHFSYILDVVGEIFQWGRPVPLVSVSEDGTKLPSVFAYYDILGLHFKNITYTPSPVVKINDRDVEEFLEDWSQVGALQDRDALYNNLFYSLAQASQSTAGTATGVFTGGGRGRFAYPGPNTTFEFANGTKYTLENYARTNVNFSKINNGEELRSKIVYEGSTSSNSEDGRPNTPGPVSKLASNNAQVEAAPPPPGYPSPVVPGPLNMINGFYIDAPGYEDVAVLQLPTFVGTGYYERVFQMTAQKFLQQAFDDGKSKLIVDLQANGGGTILQGYDVFKQIFGSLDPWGANRFRYNAAFDLIGQSFSQFVAPYPRDYGLKNWTLQSIQSSVFDYHTDMTVDGISFESWAQKAGPYEVNGYDYAATTRWNLSDPYVEIQSGINITGSGPTRWTADNIVLLTDGYCASTCSIFSEMMTQQGGVKTITFGGRNNANKIQAVGGVKGVNIYQHSYIYMYVKQAIALNNTFSTTALGEYKSVRTTNRAYAASVNTRDGLRQGDNSSVALQFKYEDADCRLYFTPEMTIDVTAIWKAAADAKWSNPSKCIGNEEGYPPYYKRAAQGKTTSLNVAQENIQGAQALRKFEALEKTFSLETEFQPQADGFMQP